MQVYKKHNFICANDSIKEVLDTIRIHKSNGDFEAAKSFALLNKDVLGDQITADVFNQIEAEIVRLEQNSICKKQVVFYNNIIDIPEYYDGKFKIHNGITYEVLDNGSIWANGIAENDSVFIIQNNFVGEKNTTYVVNGSPIGCSNDTYFMQIALDGKMGDNKQFKGGEKERRISCYIVKGTVANNLVFNPTIEIVNNIIYEKNDVVIGGDVL